MGNLCHKSVPKDHKSVPKDTRKYPKNSMMLSGNIDTPTRRKYLRKALMSKNKDSYTDTDTEQHGNNKAQVNDETFTKCIQIAKKKTRSMSNIGHQNRNTAADLANNDVDTKTKENDAY